MKQLIATFSCSGFAEACNGGMPNKTLFYMLNELKTRVVRGSCSLYQIVNEQNLSAETSPK